MLSSFLNIDVNFSKFTFLKFFSFNFSLALSLSFSLSLLVSHEITVIIIFHLSNRKKVLLFSRRFFALCVNFINFVNALTTGRQLVGEKPNVSLSVLSNFPISAKACYVTDLKNLIFMQNLVV